MLARFSSVSDLRRMISDFDGFDDERGVSSLLGKLLMYSSAVRTEGRVAILCRRRPGSREVLILYAKIRLTGEDHCQIN